MKIDKDLKTGKPVISCNGEADPNALISIKPIAKLIESPEAEQLTVIVDPDCESNKCNLNGDKPNKNPLLTPVEEPEEEKSKPGERTLQGGIIVGGANPDKCNISGYLAPEIELQDVNEPSSDKVPEDVTLQNILDDDIRCNPDDNKKVDPEDKKSPPEVKLLNEDTDTYKTLMLS